MAGVSNADTNVLRRDISPFTEERRCASFWVEEKDAGMNAVALPKNARKNNTKSLCSAMFLVSISFLIL
jgi:hypothetical protein